MPKFYKLKLSIDVIQNEENDDFNTISSLNDNLNEEESKDNKLLPENVTIRSYKFKG